MRANPARPEDLLAHADFVRGLARSLLWGEEGVDDVVQDAWAAGIATPPRDPRAARSWLGTVVRNLVRQRFRSETRRRAREESASRSESVPSTQDVLAREEQRQRVVEAVLALHPPSREVVLLRYFEDLPPREIALRLGEPVETVRTRLKRALAELRARLDEGRGGNRRAWAVLLVPLASGGGRIGDWGAGGLAMGVAAKAAAGVAAVAILGAAWWTWPREPHTPGVAPRSAKPPTEVAEAETPTTAAPPSAPVPTGPAFRGRVLDAVSAEPIAEARVSAFDAASDAAFAEAATGQEGSFSIPAGDSKRATLRLAAPGFEAVERRFAAADTTLTLRARRLCTLVIHARDPRSDPVPGAEVWTWTKGHDEFRAVTDAEGTATFAAQVNAGEVHVKVTPPPARRDLAWSSSKESLSPGQVRDLVVSLPGGLTCRGRIVDAETAVVIPGARVLAVSGMRLRDESPDAEGWFHFDGFPADREGWGSGILATADGYETSSVNFVPKTQSEVTVPLRRALTHRFRVLGVDGAPVPGAAVIVYGADRLPPVPMVEGPTDSSGEYLAGGFAPDGRSHHLVEARSPDGSSLVFAAFSVIGVEGLAARERRDGAVTLALLPRDRSLAIRTRRGATPAEGVRVRVGCVPAGREYAFRGKAGGPPRRPDLHITLPADRVVVGDTDPGGGLVLEGLPRATLVVEIDDRSDRGWLVSSRDGDATLEIDLSEAPHETTVVRGVVRTAEGPLPGAFVHLLDSEGRMRDGAPAGKDGRFQISTQQGPPWGLRVSIAAPDGSVRLVDFPPPTAGEEADLVVR